MDGPTQARTSPVGDRFQSIAYSPVMTRNKRNSASTVENCSAHSVQLEPHFCDSAAIVGSHRLRQPHYPIARFSTECRCQSPDECAGC
jgi:hypothetical protein